MIKKKIYCTNCGGHNHCGKNYKKKETEIENGITRVWYIVACQSCICIKCKND